MEGNFPLRLARKMSSPIYPCLPNLRQGVPTGSLSGQAMHTSTKHTGVRSLPAQLASCEPHVELTNSNALLNASNAETRKQTFQPKSQPVTCTKSTPIRSTQYRHESWNLAHGKRSSRSLAPGPKGKAPRKPLRPGDLVWVLQWRGYNEGTLFFCSLLTKMLLSAYGRLRTWYLLVGEGHYWGVLLWLSRGAPNRGAKATNTE